MSLATGGRAIGATSTRSSSESCASCSAVSILTMPTCSPAGPTSRTSGTRMRSLIRGSVLICPPVVVVWVNEPVLEKDLHDAREDERAFADAKTPHHEQPGC